jgi:hypothetical protein
LWASTPPAATVFDPAQLNELPAPAQSYLRHIVAADAPLATAIRLRMHGEIKLKKWFLFTTEQIIAWERGMIWQATVGMGWISIRGSVSLVAGQGRMRWRIFGIIPLVDLAGPDVTRAAAGRTNIESVWLPTVLCRSEVAWSVVDDQRMVARFTAHSEPVEITYRLDSNGLLQSLSSQRWGNPGSDVFDWEDFGGIVEEQKCFDGYTIPTQMRIDWYFGSDRFATEGEFFRVHVDAAEFH